MRNFNLGVITHIVGHLPKKETCLLEIANQIPITNKEAEKIIAEFNKPDTDNDKSKTTSSPKNKSKSKKISKK